MRKLLLQFRIEIRNYIFFVLRVPAVAQRYLRSIRIEIKKLSYIGRSIAPVQEEPWHSRGVRKIIAKSFFIYYLIDEQAKTVYVMNVIYARRNQMRALQDMKIIPKN